MREKNLHPTSYQIAIEEARIFKDSALSVHEHCKMNNCMNLPYAMSISVMLGFSIELYLKSFMLLGQGGRIIEEHSFKKLYSEFPSFLKSILETQYKKNFKSEQILVIGHIISSEKPEKYPNNNIVMDKLNRHDIRKFEGALLTISSIFVEARYFFEKLNDKDYALFYYYYEMPLAIINTLESIFELYKVTLSNNSIKK